MGNKKKKKEKIVYVDDGSTIADMSSVGKQKPKREPRQGSSYKEILQTYFASVKLMFLPMLAVLGIIALAYLIMYIILCFAQ